VLKHFTVLYKIIFEIRNYASRNTVVTQFICLNGSLFVGFSFIKNFYLEINGVYCIQDSYCKDYCTV